jgi:serine O-acetyltransferase
MRQIGEQTKIYEPTTILDGPEHDVQIGNKCAIGQYAFIAARKLVMEDGAEIGPGSIIGGGGDVTLREYSTLAYGVKLIPSTFTTAGEYMNDSIFRNKPQSTNIIRGSIVIGKGAYIGSGAVVCISKTNLNINIGDFSVIGALTYIDKDVPSNTVVHANQVLNIRMNKHEI